MTSAEVALDVLSGIFQTWMGVERMKLRNVSPRTLGRALAIEDMHAAYSAEWSRIRGVGQ